MARGATLGRLRRSLRLAGHLMLRRLLLVEHVLVLVLLLQVIMMGGVHLQMMMLLMVHMVLVVVIERGRYVERRRHLAGHRRLDPGRLQFTAAVDNGCLVAVGRAPHMAPEARVDPLDADILLLVVAGRADIDAVVRGEPRVGHALGRLPPRWRSPVMVRRDALPHLPAVAPVVALALRHGAIVLVRVTFRYHTPIPHIGNVLIRKIRTHD